MTEKSSSEELSLSIEMPALAITQVDRMGIVEGREPRRERLAIDDVDRVGDDRGALGAAGGGDRFEPGGVAAGQRQRHAGCGIVERQRLADAARGAGDDDA